MKLRSPLVSMAAGYSTWVSFRSAARSESTDATCSPLCCVKTLGLSRNTFVSLLILKKRWSLSRDSSSLGAVNWEICSSKLKWTVTFRKNRRQMFHISAMRRQKRSPQRNTRRTKSQSKPFYLANYHSLHRHNNFTDSTPTRSSNTRCSIRSLLRC